MIQSYRKKPVVIQAVRWTGTNVEVRDFLGDAYNGLTNGGYALRISTLEGVMTARYGDYIIRGVQGEFYPCKPDIFEATYEPVEE